MKVSKTWTLAEWHSGTIKQLVPAPGEGKQVVVFGLSRVSSDYSLFNLSSANVAVNWEAVYNGSLAIAAIMPNGSTNQYNNFTTIAVGASHYNGSGVKVSKDNCGVFLMPPPGVTGGIGDFTITVFYDIIDS